MKIRVQAEYQKEVSPIERDSASSGNCSFSFVTTFPEQSAEETTNETNIKIKSSGD